MKEKKFQIFVPLILLFGVALAGGLIYFIFEDSFVKREKDVCEGNYTLEFENDITVCLKDATSHGFERIDKGDSLVYESEEININNPPTISLIDEERYQSLNKVTLSDGELATTFEYQELGMETINNMNFVELASGYYPIGTVGEEVQEEFNEDAATIERYSYAYVLENGSVLLFNGEKDTWENVIERIVIEKR